MSYKHVDVGCICGRLNTVDVVGNNNADGKRECRCGRHITVHFRRHKKYNPKDDWVTTKVFERVTNEDIFLQS